MKNLIVKGVAVPKNRRPPRKKSKHKPTAKALPPWREVRKQLEMKR